MFDWEDMRVFAALARTGSHAAAARLLKVNHATVIRRVAALERALGMPLLDRAARGTALTAAGTSLAALAAGMEDAAAAIVASAPALADTLTGTVAIEAPPVLAGAFLIPQLAPFRARHPELQITVSAAPSVAAPDRRGIDLAIRLVRPETSPHLLRRLGSIAFGLYAVAELAERPPEEWTFIGYDGELDHLTQQRWLADYAGYRPTLFRTTDMLGQLAATRAGMGVALLPRFIADEVEALVRVDAGAMPPRRTIWLSSAIEAQKRPAVRATADFLAQAFADSGLFAPSVND